jgi:P4 family phage/plasmid primase-like protien
MTAMPTEQPDSGPGGEVIPLHAGIDLTASAYFERGDQVELAEKVLETLGPVPLTCDAGEVWQYQPARGIWEIVPGPRLRTIAASFAGCPVGVGNPKPRKDGTVPEKRVVKLTAPAVAGAVRIGMDRLEADPDRVTFNFARGDGPRGVAFRNGFVTVRDGAITLLPHAPEHRARHAYDFDYDDTLETPLLDAFFAELFKDTTALERDLRTALLQEFVGACLIGEATRYQRCIVLYGTGGNGKGELLRILRGLFPPEAVCGLVPQWWGDRFRAVLLLNKLANFCDELPDAEIMGGEAWKLVVTGDPIPMERKNRDAFMHAPNAGHMFATNTPIRTTDHSDGFWRRPLVVALTRKFEGDGARVLDAGAKVLEMEAPAIAAWGIRGAARAQTQGGYTVPPSSLALSRQWRDENDQVRGYFAEQPITGRVQADTLYKAYKTWASDNGLGPMSSTMFARRIQAAELAHRERSGGKSWYTPREPERVATSTEGGA